MTVVHVASEIAPIAKVGGLGDVVYGLARATAQEGHSVEVWLPNYDQIPTTELDHLERRTDHLWKASLHGVNLVLVDLPKYFHRGKIYGFHDDVDRFAHFSKAVVDALASQSHPPDVIHIHDWQTALIAPLVRTLKWNKTKIILTIHSLEHQGRALPHQIAFTGIDPSIMIDPRKSTDINLLMGGILCANTVVTVSPTYLNEILTPKKGQGLDVFLEQHRSKMHGILNGIDYSYWDPAKDPHLICPYTPSTLAGKAENKSHLRRRFGLREDDSPLIASVTRLVPQKAPELIEKGLHYTLKNGGQFILLGSSPIEEIGDHFANLKTKLEGPHAAFFLEYDEPLSHLVYAGADMLLVPSHFEPCGLTQMIALRYGAIPIVRATGGLKDSVIDYDDAGQPREKRSGFTFEAPDGDGVEGALGRALKVYKEKPDEWKQLILHGMNQDFSWKHSAQEYLKLYTYCYGTAIEIKDSNFGIIF